MSGISTRRGGMADQVAVLLFLNGGSAPPAGTDPALYRVGSNLIFRDAAGVEHRLTATAADSGTATLVGGTVTVASAVLTANSKIMVTRNTPGGTVGHLSAPFASRNTTDGTFVLNSDSNTETSTVDWAILN